MSISQFGWGAAETSFASAQNEEETPSATTVDRTDMQEIPRGSERILVVDDDRVARTIALQLLTKLGYTVETCANGIDALAGLAGSIQSFDLLFTDYNMPGLTGYELACRVQEQHPDLRVILTSGWPEELLRTNAVSRDWPAFLPKPYTPQSLARKVREVFATPAPSCTGAVLRGDIRALDDIQPTEGS